MRVCRVLPLMCTWHVHVHGRAHRCVMFAGMPSLPLDTRPRLALGALAAAAMGVAIEALTWLRRALVAAAPRGGGAAGRLPSWAPSWAPSYAWGALCVCLYALQTGSASGPHTHGAPLPVCTPCSVRHPSHCIVCACCGRCEDDAHLPRPSLAFPHLLSPSPTFSLAFPHLLSCVRQAGVRADARGDELSGGALPGRRARQSQSHSLTNCTLITY